MRMCSKNSASSDTQRFLVAFHAKPVCLFFLRRALCPSGVIVAVDVTVNADGGWKSCKIRPAWFPHKTLVEPWNK